MDADREHQPVGAGISGKGASGGDDEGRPDSFMGSYAGMQAYSSSLVYSVSKAGVLFLAKGLVKELEPKGITVNTCAGLY